LKAAAMMESLFIGRESDLLALKLAQDSYILAGDSANTLGCVARYLHLFDADSDQYGSVMGLLAMGLLECGNYSEAEEMASKAVNLTNGLDVWALHTLLNIYQILGRSSEVGSAVNDHIGKHLESSVGLSILLFNKGCGLVQRGNYTGALKAHDEMIYLMARSVDKEGQIAGSITNATLLLWLVDVNSPSGLVDERWNYIESTAGMWTEGLSSENGRNLMSLSPMNELCRSIAIGAAERCATAAAPSSMSRHSRLDNYDDEDDIRYTKSTKKSLTEAQLMADLEGKVTNIESKAKKVWEWIRGFTNPSYVKPDDETVGRTPEEIASIAAEHADKLEATALLHQNHLTVLRAFLQSGKIESQSLSDICPSLLAMKSRTLSMSRIPESPEPTRVSDRKWAIESVSEPLSEAMLAFSRHDYDEASDRLLHITRSPILNRLGGSIVQRDIVKQTLIGTLQSLIFNLLFSLFE
jgi:tetratricopeptide (TPR) repeat protein